MDNEIDRKIDVTAILFLLVQDIHQTHDWTLIGSSANGLGIQECKTDKDVRNIEICFLTLNLILIQIENTFNLFEVPYFCYFKVFIKRIPSDPNTIRTFLKDFSVQRIHIKVLREGEG